MKAEQQYIDLYTKNKDIICTHAHAIMNDLRDEAFGHFCEKGLPDTDNERYKHTDFQAAFLPDYGVNLRRLAFPLSPVAVFRCDVPNMSPFHYFVVNDIFNEAASPDTSLPEGVFAGSLRRFMDRYPDIARRYYGKAAPVSDNAINALNTTFVQDGFALYVPKGVRLAKPVQLINVFNSATPLMANRRILVVIEDDAEASLLVCDHSSDEVDFLATQVVEVFVGEHSHFDFYDLEESSIRTRRFATFNVRQATASNVVVGAVTLNNGLTRNEFDISLDGKNAETTLCGMAIQDRQQSLDTFTKISHLKPYCRSNELFKNVLHDSATGAFLGLILVEKDAVKTEASQTNRNLCTTREAKMFSQPQLEIYADDVKCSHGMTTGQIDEQALFYMRSRGIAENEARTMLGIAFLSEVTAKIRLAALRDRLALLIEKRFRGELARCAECAVYTHKMP